MSVGFSGLGWCAVVAVAVGMALTVDGAYEFCEGHIMPPMEVAMVLQGMPMAERGNKMASKSSTSERVGGG
jgi:hypothetical protein